MKAHKKVSYCNTALLPDSRMCAGHLKLRSLWLVKLHLNRRYHWDEEMLLMFFFSLENCYLTSPADFAPLPADVSSSSSDCSDRVAAAACCTHTLADFISDVAPEELQMVLRVYSDLSIPQKPGPFKLLWCIKSFGFSMCQSCWVVIKVTTDKWRPRLRMTFSWERLVKADEA